MASASATGHRSGRDLRIYVVEDNALVWRNLLAALEELVGVVPMGHAESEADGGAWLADPRSGWDLAIVDIFLKQGTGFGVLQACRARPADKKVVVLTNYATPGVRERCLALGADGVFDKSAEIEALLDYCIQLRGARAHDA